MLRRSKRNNSGRNLRCLPTRRPSLVDATATATLSPASLPATVTLSSPECSTDEETPVAVRLARYDEERKRRRTEDSESEDESSDTNSELPCSIEVEQFNLGDDSEDEDNAESVSAVEEMQDANTVPY